MNIQRLTLRLLVLVVFTLAFTSFANAQATRTWVSGVGDDVNPCSRTAPCKTYAGAISKTAKDGEISTLDPGGFGTITITKSITINGGNGGQGYGSILSALAPQGVLVNITDPADVRKTVRLDWININGASTGTHGVRILAGSKVSIENSLIDGVVSNGVDTNVTVATEVNINRTTIRNCAGVGASAFGSGTVAMSITDSNLFGNGTGVRANDFSRVSVIRTTASSSTTANFVANAQTAGRQSELNLVDVGSYNANLGTGKGVVSGGTTTGNIVRMGGTSVFTNVTGVEVVAGNTVFTYGNNMINGNGTDLTGTLSAFPAGTGLR